MNIVLIGYRGTGKSHVGFLLARQFGRQVVSVDEEIVKTAGMSIPEIVEQFGWADFRDRETAEVSRLAGRDELVIDCGGGIIERNENIDILRQNGRIFWLKASVATIVERLRGKLSLKRWRRYSSGVRRNIAALQIMRLTPMA
jgi:shikimate kinase